MFMLWILAIVSSGVGLRLAYMAIESKLENRLFNSRSKMLPNWAYPLLAAPFITAWTCIFLSPLYLEFQGVGDRLFVFEDGKAIEKRYAFMWEWDKFANVPNAVFGKSQVTVLTSNPKSREISYRTAAAIINPNSYFANLERKKRFSENVKEDVQKLVLYWCYEFNEINGRELAKFYNPTDKRQQQEFGHLLESWMNERLSKEGVQVKSEGFAVR